MYNEKGKKLYSLSGLVPLILDIGGLPISIFIAYLINSLDIVSDLGAVIVFFAIYGMFCVSSWIIFSVLDSFVELCINTAAIRESLSNKTEQTVSTQNTTANSNS